MGTQNEKTSEVGWVLGVGLGGRRGSAKILSLFTMFITHGLSPRVYLGSLHAYLPCLQIPFVCRGFILDLLCCKFSSHLFLTISVVTAQFRIAWFALCQAVGDFLSRYCAFLFYLNYHNTLGSVNFHW